MKAGPTLTSPEAEEDSVSIPTSFEWTEVEEAATYELQISKGPEFDTTRITVPNISNTEYEYEGLEDTTRYFWRVRAEFEDGTMSGWSPSRFFETVLRSPETPAWDPEDGEEGVSSDLILSWNETSRAEVYQVQLAEGEDFESLVAESKDIETTTYEIEEELAGQTTYYWRVRAGNESGYSDWSEALAFTTEMTTSVEGKEQPREFSLGQNYPNPFNPSTTISYELPENSNVQLTVFDMLGQRVATLVNEQQSAGQHEVNFDASRLSSGIYIYRITAGEFSQTRQMVLIK
jgi:hypothetical protein